jgi:hypothetical protein
MMEQHDASFEDVGTTMGEWPVAPWERESPAPGRGTDTATAPARCHHFARCGQVLGAAPAGQLAGYEAAAGGEAVGWLCPACAADRTRARRFAAAMHRAHPAAEYFAHEWRDGRLSRRRAWLSWMSAP